MNDKQVIDKLKVLVNEGQVLKTRLLRYRAGYSVEYDNNNYSQEGENWRAKCLNLLKLRFGADSEYYLNFSKKIDTLYNSSGRYCEDNVGRALGALQSVLDAIESGLTDDLYYKKEVELLSDLLEQAYEFLRKGFKLAAGIYGRVVLETTLREFANRHGIREESFDQLIIKLRINFIITKPFENSLRANYEIGSWAAHGKDEYDKMSDAQKQEFLNFIRDKVLNLS